MRTVGRRRLHLVQQQEKRATVTAHHSSDKRIRCGTERARWSLRSPRERGSTAVDDLTIARYLPGLLSSTQVNGTRLRKARASFPPSCLPAQSPAQHKRKCALQPRTQNWRGIPRRTDCERLHGGVQRDRDRLEVSHRFRRIARACKCGSYSGPPEHTAQEANRAGRQSFGQIPARSPMRAARESGSFQRQPDIRQPTFRPTFGR